MSVDFIMVSDASFRVACPTSARTTLGYTKQKSSIQLNVDLKSGLFLSIRLMMGIESEPIAHRSNVAFAV